VKSDQHFCLIVEEDGSFQPAVIDMKSTQLKVSRRWKTQIAMQKVKNPKTGVLMTPPVYATMWRLYSVEESNDQGSWGNWQVERIGLVENRRPAARGQSLPRLDRGWRGKGCAGDRPAMGGFEQRFGNTVLGSLGGRPFPSPMWAALFNLSTRSDQCLLQKDCWLPLRDRRRATARRPLVVSAAKEKPRRRVWCAVVK
jgi:hypothetical protein